MLETLTRLLPLLLSLALVSGGGAVTAAESPNETEIVSEAVATARGLVKSDNPYDRILGAGTLTDVGDGAALELLEGYAVSNDFVFRRSAIDTLVNVQHPAGLDLVYRIAAGNGASLHFIVQSLATNPRQEMSGFLVAALDSDKMLIQQLALQALVLVEGDDAVGRVRALLATPGVARTTRAYGFYYLASRGFGDEVLPELLELARSKDIGQQEVAAVALGYVSTDASRAAIKTLSASPNPQVSLVALATAAGAGDFDAFTEVMEIITRGKAANAEVAARTIRRWPPALARRATEFLIAENIRPDPASRLVESWREIDSDAEAIYSWGLNHSNADIRMQTLWLIGQRMDRAWLPQMATFLKDADPGVRGMAAWAIVHIAVDAYSPSVAT